MTKNTEQTNRIEREFTPDERQHWEKARDEEERGKSENIAAAKARKAQAVLERHPVVLEILQQLSIAKEEQGLSYADLTERTGIERSSLARLLNSGTNPKLLTLEALAKALGKNLKVTVTD
ncbi:MAG: helix-turn-helix transcriptional regulator [Planctomicrobium sp.]|jgi:DNA-binding phage protein|nr:helix-turn-helix transcriptional regulator [Planctomicrobium sp.]